jgi:hypothetical protein
MNATALFTHRPFDVQILANGIDITAKSPVVGVFYDADGTGTRALRDGRVLTGQWRFINSAQTQIEVVGPEGTSRWVIVELNEAVYRKVNIDTGVEFVHRPRVTSA